MPLPGMKSNEPTLASPKHPTRHIGNTGNPECYTPSYIVEIAREVMGGIDLDPLSSAEAQQTVGAVKYYDENEDGFSKEWNGRVWCNPPYDQKSMRKTADKIAESAIDQLIMITNTIAETKYGVDLIGMSKAVCLPAGRVKFYKGGGTVGQTIYAFGNVDIEKFADLFSRIGNILVLNRGYSPI